MATVFDSISSTKQVCARHPFLNEGTLRYLRHKNAGPRSFVINGRVFYRDEDVEAWLAAQEEATARGGSD